MGVTGLWSLLGPVGRPVPLESLENKVLAVDVSIWLNQALKGFRDAEGRSQPNAHLLGIFHRVCKLLFFKIKPVFVFDGTVPLMKKQTTAARQKKRQIAKDQIEQLAEKVLANQLARNVISNAKNQKSDELFSKKRRSDDDIFLLPELPKMFLDATTTEDDSDNDASQFEVDDSFQQYYQNLSDIDITSVDFESLPLEIRHEIISKIKERGRKHFTQLHKMPSESQSFSRFQIDKLLKRRYLQSKLEVIQKEMMSQEAGRFMSELEGESVVETRKIASEDATHTIYIKNKNIKPIDTTKTGVKIAEESSNNSEDIIDKGSPNIELSQDEVWINMDIFGENSKSRNFESHSKCCTIPKELPEVVDLDDSTSGSEEVSIVAQTTYRAEFEKPIHHSDICSGESKQSDLEKLSAIKQSGYARETQNKLGENIIDVHDFPVNEALKIPSDKLRTSSTSTEKFEIFIDVSKKVEDELFPSDIFDADGAVGLSKYRNNVNTQIETPNEYHSIHKDSEQSTIEFKSNNQSDKIEEVSKGLETNSPSSSTPDSLPVESTRHKAIQNVLVDFFCKRTAPKASAVKTVNSTKDGDAFVDSNELGVNPEPFTSSSLEQKDDSNDISKVHKDGLTPCLSGYTDEELKQMEEKLDIDTEALIQEQRKQERMASTVSDQIYQESQEILKLFGVPYIISPTEAEAQCAQLEILGLTQGTITDDSDIWLFGGNNVYKNFFTQGKYLEWFKSQDVKTQFGLDRSKLACFALLTGSDYTVGLNGVGYVRAMEILSEFKGEGMDALKNFKDWWQAAKDGKIPPGNNTRSKFAKLELSEGFPNLQIYEAYLKPMTDQSKERFSWGIPDLCSLRELAKEKFGWTQTKVDEMLLPVLKKVNETKSQTRIDSFFSVQLKKVPEVFPSKRLKKAVAKLNDQSEDETIPRATKNKVPVKRKGKLTKNSKVKKTSVIVQKVNLSESSEESS